MWRVRVVRPRLLGDVGSHQRCGAWPDARHGDAAEAKAEGFAGGWPACEACVPVVHQPRQVWRVRRCADGGGGRYTASSFLSPEKPDVACYASLKLTFSSLWTAAQAVAAAVFLPGGRAACMVNLPESKALGDLLHAAAAAAAAPPPQTELCHGPVDAAGRPRRPSKQFPTRRTRRSTHRGDRTCSCSPTLGYVPPPHGARNSTPAREHRASTSL